MQLSVQVENESFLNNKVDYHPGSCTDQMRYRGLKNVGDQIQIQPVIYCRSNRRGESVFEFHQKEFDVLFAFQGP